MKTKETKTPNHYKYYCTKMDIKSYWHLISTKRNAAICNRIMRWYGYRLFATKY